MPTIWTEEQVTLEALATHFRDSGMGHVDKKEGYLLMYSSDGIAVTVGIDESRKFLKFSSCLPLQSDEPHQRKLDLMQEFNYNVFLPCFALDRDDDLLASYLMCYEFGLIIGQCMRVLLRFSSLMDHLVRTKNGEGLIDFSKGRSDSAFGIDEEEEATGPAPAHVLLN